MSKRIGVSYLFGLAAAAGLSFAGAASGEPPPRAPLDALWEQHMLEGRGGAMEFRNSHIDVSEYQPARSFEYAHGRPEGAVATSHGITVMRLGEGFWREGGWLLKGGLLGRVSAGLATFDLYGKAVVRRLPYFPFPFHRAIPHETGYEFFLLHRPAGAPRATIVRRWVVRPDDVVVERRSDGGTVEWVQAKLEYDSTTRTSIVTVAGLKRPFEERVNLSSELESAPR